ncbi:unnamed protein product [Rhizoctonia solani]|uniref:Peptidase A1 domain-containing protein n=1 Tax=Rhizoctonia solani TaxID=456999 RepID=A0A8H3E8C3_9AGAM|nr:unnamed protein product [Rhizoctonia solani]
MAFGVAAPAGGVEMHMDGILGLRRALGRSVVTLDNGSPVPNIVDALLEQGQIRKNMFGVSLAPVTSQGVINGRLTFGGTSPQRYKGGLNWVDITSGSLRDYWAFEQTIKYGDQVIQPSSAGIVDTGTTLLHITRQAFDDYARSIPGSQTDASTGLLEIPENSIIYMRPLSFVIDGKPYEFTSQAQLWPRELNRLIGGKENIYYSVINWLNEDSAAMGLNFVGGYAFLQRVYTAYDASNLKIGFANYKTSST